MKRLSEIKTTFNEGVFSQMREDLVELAFKKIMDGADAAFNQILKKDSSLSKKLRGILC